MAKSVYQRKKAKSRRKMAETLLDKRHIAHFSKKKKGCK